MNKLSFILGLIILMSSCKSKLEEEGIFPKVKDVTHLKRTDFVQTLEGSFNTDNNIIYAATLPFAWNEIRNELGGTLTDFTSKDLEELNNTRSYLQVLKEEEYETSVEVDGNEIRAKAYFKISLPFEEPLTKFDEPLNFGNSKVESFGFWGSCIYARINYFNNENDFSISLFPENQDHEIILIMYHDAKNVIRDFNEYFLRLNEQKDEKVYFNHEDKVEIPIVEFNLEKTLDQFIGSKFRANLKEYEVTEVLQRNAFILNENGAEVESYAEMATEALEEIEKPEPKLMIFNKPFVVLLKRKDASNPYFGVYIANDELVKKK